MSDWVQDDSLKGLSDTFAYKFEGHNPIKRKSMPWLVCKHCGLIYLRNKFTSWAIKKGCMNHWHPEKIRFIGRKRI